MTSGAGTKEQKSVRVGDSDIQEDLQLFQAATIGLPTVFIPNVDDPDRYKYYLNKPK